MDEMNQGNPFANHRYSNGRGRQPQQARGDEPRGQQHAYGQQASGGYQPQPQYRQPYNQGYAQSAPVQFGNPRAVVPIPPEKKKFPWVKIVIAFLIGLVLGFAGGSAGKQSSKNVGTGEEKTVAATSKDDDKQDEKNETVAPETDATTATPVGGTAPAIGEQDLAEAPQEVDPVAEQPAEDFSVTDEFLDASNQFSASITGVLVNNTDKDYHYVQIEYILYDADGNQIGTAYDNISNLKAGGSWKFSAMTLKAPAELGHYERGEITAW